MEAFDGFVELFNKLKTEKNDSDLTDILKNGSSYFQNLSTSEIGLVLSVFLNDKTGLLHLLGNTTDKTMENSIIEGFKLLKFIVQQFYWLLDPYVMRIKNVCQSAIITRSSQIIKTAAADCFESLVMMCPSHNLELNETVHTFVRTFHLCTYAERAKFFKALGSIANYHPEAISPADCRTIVGRVMSDFEERYSKSKPGSQSSELAIYLELLKNLLTNFSLHEPSERSEYYKKLYRYIKELSNINITQQLKFVSRAAVALLGRHMPAFIDYVYEDASFWHNTLLKWTKLTGENGVVAFHALCIYYEQMGIILESNNTENGRQIFEHLKQHFENQFINDNVESIILQSSIRGFGHMAGACKNYTTENDVRQMFSLIAQKTAIMYANDNEMTGSLENIAYYQVALSEILLHISEVSLDQLTVLSTLSSILIKRFPDLPVTSHSLTVASLMKIIRNIERACRRSYEKFIQTLVYEGIVWSCSHTLYIDAEREREMKNLNEHPVCYQNYLPLWQPLICRNKTNNIGSFTIPIEIFKNMIETCVRLISKLNLGVRSINISCEIEAFDMPIAVNDTDFRVFINLVDLFIAILEKVEPDLMESKMDWFFCEIIKNSNKNPLISGFYKLIHVVLKLYNLSFDAGDSKLLDETFRLMSRYLSDTIDRLSSFSGELHSSCINMIFEMPVSMAENMLDRLITVFKIAFSLGQSNFNTAQSALSTLEEWTKTIHGERMTNFLIEVVPSLESFLQSNESTMDLTQDILLNKRKVIKNIVLTDHEKSLQEFQKRILLFFGSLNSEVTSYLVAEQTLSELALDDHKNLLKYTLLYKDIKPDIYLDAILPRTIELALNSTDRRTRVVACEMLHSIVIVMLGRTMQFLSSNPDRLLPLFKKICPALLRLGSDSDQVIQQLFHPLMIQLTHWYSSKIMLKSSETVYLIEILFDLLTYESNMALSDFCGVCLAEFVKWSIKQSTDAELQTPSTNIVAIMSKITNFALHPSMQKRVGAAVAFNYLYTILREYNIIIDVYWLELLYCFIKSLDGCNSTQIFKSLKHIERVIDNRSEILNKENPQRSKPTEFAGTLLKNAVDWLLMQCGSLDPNCRSKSMELLGRISKHVPEFGSIEKVFLDYINSNSVQGLNQIILKDLHPQLEILSAETLKPLMRTLDCYIWILNENIINFDLLFGDKIVDKDKIFNCVINFIHFLNVKPGENECSEFTSQYQDSCVFKCQTILKIFDFMTILLIKMETPVGTNLFSYIPTFFWNKELCMLISTLIFKPDVIGFDLQYLGVTESLPSSLKILLSTLIQKLNNTQLLQWRELIAKEIESKYKDFLDFNQIFNNDTSIVLKNYLKGLIMLETVDEYGKLYERPLSSDDSANGVIQIFNLLKKEQFGKVVCVDVKSSEKEYLENIMKFLFFKCEPNMIITLVNIADSKTELSHRNSTTIFHGEYFMNLFGIPIFQNLLKHLSRSMDTFLSDFLKDKFYIVLIILEDLLTYVKKNKKYCKEFLSTLQEEFVQRFSKFRHLTNGVEKMKEKVINLYSLLVYASENPSAICSQPNELYSWIMQGLLGYLDLEYKTRMLNNFLLCIVDETAHKKQELIRCLHKLKMDFYPNNMNNVLKGSLEHSNIIASFKTLVRHLPTLKSVTLFDCVIHLTVGNIEYFWDNSSTTYLTAYFNEMSTDNSGKSLQILYKYFMTTENSEARLEILNNLLLKCIHFCSMPVVEHFFEQNIKQIHETILRELSANGSTSKNLIVSKIGCYNLLEIMFAKVPLEKISSTDSKIARNAIETIKSGKELFQSLNSNVLGIRKLKFESIELKELIRLMHCAAYNCSIAVVSLKCEEQFYVLPFAESKSKGQLIWENIIDMDRNYEFKEDFKEIPKEYKKLINIRKQCNLAEPYGYSHIKSYNLAESTLNEDLSCFDMYESNLRSNLTAETIGKDEMMSLTFEYDDLNNHECMAPICGVIMHMVATNIFNLPSDGENFTMPKWMQFFLSSLNGTMVHNVKLFMIKVIVNMQEVFKPYGKFLLTPILNFLTSQLKIHQQINYMIKDILIMLIDWQRIAVPSQNIDKRLAQNLLEMLIKNADNEQRHIYKYNVEMINMLVEAWKSCLDVPKGILKIRNASPKFILRMILTFLSNDKQESLGSRHEVLVFLMRLFDHSDEEIILHTSNAFGLILTFLESKNNADSETKEWIINNIGKSVIDKSYKNPNKYIKCIHEIHRFYPNIIKSCFRQLISHFYKIDNNNKEKCLELYLSAMPNFKENEIITALGFIKFQDILINKILTCQHVALRIIEKLLNILQPSNYLPLALLVVPYSKDIAVTQRELVMDIFIATYRKYNNDIEDNVAINKLKELSRRILLFGLLDTNESVQKKILNFWAEEGNITDKSIERILEIFNMYDADLESSYLPILPLMMLHLVSKDPEFKKKMFEPLSNCKFEDYQVAIMWRSKQVGLEAPLFTSSLISQMSQYYSKSNQTFARFNQTLNQSLFLRASQSLQFKQTVSKDQSFFQSIQTTANEFNNSAVCVDKIPQPARNIKSKRMLKNTADVRDHIRQNQISINLRRNKMLNEEADRQRNRVRMYRKYRIGDFPDTEITHSSLIEPLQELVKNDQVIARDLTVAIFDSMLKEMSPDQKKQFLEKLSISLEHILERTHGYKPLIATVLEIILNSYEMHISSNVIAKVSKSCGLLSLGALLLEEKMISGFTTENSDPPPKRSKIETETYDNTENDWLQLANIYKSMSDFDSVQSIFGCDKFGKELQEASFAQAASKWSVAKTAYEKAYEMSQGPIKDYCQESLFICLAHLSDWKQINKHIVTELKGNFNTLWRKPINENWMASWLLQAQIHGMLQNDYDDRFPEALNDWVNAKDKLTQLKGLFGEEVAIFYMDQNPEFSESCLMSGLEKIRLEWKHLNPIYCKQKINKYLKLRGLSDIKTYLKEIQNKHRLTQNVQCILTFWNNSLPARQDNLVLWDKHIAYRLYMFELLKQQLVVQASNEPNETLDAINAAVVKHSISIAEAAYDQGNLYFMRKYLRYSEQYKDDHLNLNDDWQLAFAKYRYLCYTDCRPQDKRVEAYIASWNQSHELLISNCVDTKLQMNVRQHISTLIVELQKLVVKSEPISRVLLGDDSISQYLYFRHDQDSIVKQLSDYCLRKLKECCESRDSRNTASCYLKISMYCHSMSDSFTTGLDLSKEFIHSTLSAMSYGSIEASQYFPCLLHLDYLNNCEWMEIFERLSVNVEAWMFLKWQAQLLSHVGTSICSLVAPILCRLAKAYPDFFIYSFRMTMEMNKSLLYYPLIRKLTEILKEKKDLELFLEAMKYLVQPELYLKYHVNELEANTVADLTVAVNNLITAVYPSTQNADKIVVQGEVYKVIEKFKKEITEMVHKEGKELFLCKRQIIHDLDAALKTRIKHGYELSLKKYSPWLCKFNGGNIEVPGQYIADKKPMPQYHAKIVKLCPKVTILPSLRKPIKITMLGNNGKNYSFLVKFGEDLRTDERIEQLFMLMNKILQRDSVCRRRQLSVDTYLVLPLTGSLGLIQWIDNTRSLNEIINSVLTADQKKQRENIISSFINWMSNPTAGQSIEAIYNKGILRYDRQEVTAKFNYLKTIIGWDTLRKAFKRLSVSPESFFTLRRNFITSYATVCIAQWILGIGDRNLSNTLVSYTSGKALGIDFGYSFDAAVDSAVPELMPFRLTPQILGLLRPFDENGLLKVTMINVLRAIKNGKDPLLACMDIFVKEPSLDWLASKKILADRQEGSDLKWYPKKKLNIVLDKLNGTKPSKLTLLQIRDRYSNTEYYNKYVDIINGSDDGLQLKVRSGHHDENLSTEEQVECLLDQAMDPNILARTWYGWEPWI